MDTQKGDVGNQVSDILKTIQTLSGEIRVRAHLFSLEMKDAWAKLEPQVFHAEQLAKKASKETRIALADLAARLKSFRSKLK